MTKMLEAHEKTIREVFSGNYFFHIPVYQRPYSWGVEQTGELFDDLLTAMQENKKGEYFLGSVVLIEKPDNQFDVVDGQQRLTTLTILFSVLRNFLGEKIPEISDLIKNNKCRLKSLKDLYYFTARDEDEDFFRENIQEPEGFRKFLSSKKTMKDSMLRYRENAWCLFDRMVNLQEEGEDPDVLLKLWDFLVDSCSLVVIVTPDMDSAYRIFSVLNNRGLDLQNIDIIKAELLGEIRESGADDSYLKGYAKTWTDMESDLSRDGFSELLGHIRSIYANRRKQEGTLVEDFKKFVKKDSSAEALIENIIEPYADAWKIISQREYQEDVPNKKRINEHLYWLSRMDFHEWAPAALYYVKNYGDDHEYLERFLYLLERYTFYLAVSRASRMKRIEYYLRLIREMKGLDIYSGEESDDEEFSGDPDLLSSLDLSDDEIVEFTACLNGDIYSRLPKMRLNIVLRLESLLRDQGATIVWDEKTMTLEHVLPQTPMKTSQWVEDFTKDERNEWVHRLANLVLLNKTKNSKARNFNFTEKKREYFFYDKRKRENKTETDVPFVLTQQLRDSRVWTPRTLKERQGIFLDKFRDYWKLYTYNYMKSQGWC